MEPDCEPNSMAAACDALATLVDSISDDELEINPSQGEKTVLGKGGKIEPSWQTASDQKRHPHQHGY